MRSSYPAQLVPTVRSSWFSQLVRIVRSSWTIQLVRGVRSSYPQQLVRVPWSSPQPQLVLTPRSLHDTRPELAARSSQIPQLVPLVWSSRMAQLVPSIRPSRHALQNLVATLLDPVDALGGLRPDRAHHVRLAVVRLTQLLNGVRSHERQALRQARDDPEVPEERLGHSTQHVELAVLVRVAPRARLRPPAVPAGHDLAAALAPPVRLGLGLSVRPAHLARQAHGLRTLPTVDADECVAARPLGRRDLLGAVAGIAGPDYRGGLVDLCRRFRFVIIVGFSDLHVLVVLLDHEVVVGRRLLPRLRTAGWARHRRRAHVDPRCPHAVVDLLVRRRAIHVGGGLDVAAVHVRREQPHLAVESLRPGQALAAILRDRAFLGPGRHAVHDMQASEGPRLRRGPLAVDVERGAHRRSRDRPRSGDTDQPLHRGERLEQRRRLLEVGLLDGLELSHPRRVPSDVLLAQVDGHDRDGARLLLAVARRDAELLHVVDHRDDLGEADLPHPIRLPVLDPFIGRSPRRHPQLRHVLLLVVVLVFTTTVDFYRTAMRLHRYNREASRSFARAISSVVAE